jgi:hypothetical protein
MFICISILSISDVYLMWNDLVKYFNELKTKNKINEEGLAFIMNILNKRKDNNCKISHDVAYVLDPRYLESEMPVDKYNAAQEYIIDWSIPIPSNNTPSVALQLVHYREAIAKDGSIENVLLKNVMNDKLTVKKFFRSLNSEKHQKTFWRSNI